MLLNELRTHRADLAWVDPDREPHEWLMSCWDRGVSPHGMIFEATKEMGRLFPRIVKPFRDVLRHLE